MVRKLPLFLVLAIAGGLSAMPAFALQGTPSPGAGIAPVVWQLTRIVPPSAPALTPSDPSLNTLQFLPDGRVNVRADCNSGQGTYEIDGSTLTIGPVAMTMMACAEESIGTEFAANLDHVSSFAYAEDELVLTTDDGGTLHFVPSLIGVVWEWQEFLGGNMQQVIPEDPSRYTITFEDESNFAVRADCNTGRGTYTTDGPSIDLTIGPMTRAMCPPESHSDQFLRDLDDTTSFTFRDGHLHLSLMADAGTSTFAARAIDDEGTPLPGEGTPVEGSPTPG